MAVRAPVQFTVLTVGDGGSLVESALETAAGRPLEATPLTAADAAEARGYLEGGRVDCAVVAGAGSEPGEGVVDALAPAATGVPIVGVVDDAATASAVLEAGATDYVQRGVAEEHPELVVDRILRAVENAPAGAFPGSRGWYDALLEHSMDALTVLDGDGTFTYQSPSVERLLGYEPEELVGASSLEYVHPEDEQRVEETFERLYDRGDGSSEELGFRFRRADGGWEWVEAIATARTQPGIGGYVVNSRLITERKEREQEVEYYETLLDLMPDTVVVTDLEGTITDITASRAGAATPATNWSTSTSGR